MPKFTLLEMTQKVLSSIDGDEVNSITDTVESEQVADIIERSYWALIDNKLIPEHYTLLQLDGVADSSKPTHMKLPTGVDKISSVRYNVIKTGATDANYTLIPYCSVDKFLSNSLSLKSTGSNVQTVSENGTDILIENNKAPSYWTSFDDEFMVFNSFDNTVDSTLQQSKTVVYGAKEPTWVLDDAFTPDMDNNLFVALLNDAISMAHLELKQQAHNKAEKNARTSMSRAQQYKYRASDEPYLKRPDYGRKGYGRRRKY